ncbi:MAG: DUF6443 domain-containing protein [Bacteroidota bacterium]
MIMFRKNILGALFTWCCFAMGFSQFGGPGGGNVYSISGPSVVDDGSTHGFSLNHGSSIASTTWGISNFYGNVDSSTATTATISFIASGTVNISALVTDNSGNIQLVGTTVTVNPGLSPGTISGQQTVCYSGNPTNLASTAAASGGSGNYTYQWQDSPVGGTGTLWSDIPGATSLSYDPPGGLTATKWYRRTVSSGGLTKFTETIKVTVNPPLDPGSINGAQTICQAENPTALSNVSLPSYGLGGYVYQWQYSGTGSGGWTNIGGATSSSYTPPSGPTATRWYRRRVVACAQTAYSDPVKITVKPLPAAPNVNVALSCGPGVVTLTASGISGATYKWYNASGEHIIDAPSYSPTLASSTDYQVSAVVNGCEGPRAQVTATVTALPEAPSLGAVTQPGCSDPLGSFTIVNFNNNPNSYTVNPAAGATISSFGVVSAPQGNYTVTVSVNNCTATSEVRSIGPQPQPPLEPAIGTVSQPTCENPSGSFAITNFGGDPLAYTITPPNGASISNAGLVTAPSGDYTLTYTENDCVSGSAMVTVDPAPSATTWYLDADADGYYSGTQQSCSSPGTGWTEDDTLQPGDCDDSFPSQDNDCPPPVTGDPDDHNYVYSRTYQEEGHTTANRPAFFGTGDDLIQQITYFDGLGRAVQQNAIRQNPQGKDMVTHMGYDDYWRMEKEWLTLTDGTQIAEFGHFMTDDMETATRSYYDAPETYGADFPNLSGNEVNPYSEKLFEASPLNRVRKQAAPGEAWKLDPDGDDHSIEFSYETNAIDEVRMFAVATSFADNTFTPSLVFLKDTGNNDREYYPPGELYRNVTRDENHTSTGSATDKLHTTEEFTDKQGRTVLKRTYALVGGTEEPHDTYYVYDDFGNLTYVLPPKMEASTTALADLDTRMDELGYQYVYDHRNRLVEKRIPGKGWEYIVYNQLDQPIMTQDANQRENGEWLFTKYDAFGRVAYTGKAVETGDHSRTDIQDQVNGLTSQLWVAQQGSNRDGDFTDTVTIHYDNGAYPDNSISGRYVDLTEVLTINYYDGYGFDRANEPIPPAAVFGADVDDRTQGLPTGSKIRILDTDDWITTITRYDDKARPIYTYSENEYLGSVDIVESQLDFVGRPLKVRSAHTRNGSTIVTLDNFTYDHVGRLLSQTQCIGDAALGENCPTGDAAPATVTWDGTVDGDITTNLEATESIIVTDADILPGPDGETTLRIVSGSGQELIVYNDYDALGQLVQKKVGGVPGTDYTGTGGLQTVDYAYNIRGWLKQINNPSNLGSDLWGMRINYNDPTNFGGNENPDALFNGNISQTLWKTASVNPDPPGNPVSERYSFGYDALNRITNAHDNTGNYDVTGITYDKMGNIMSLVRDGFQNGSAFADMDVLDYDYDSGNKLLKVSDTGNKAHGFIDGTNTNDDFGYDQNGNLKLDRNKGITAITYNHLNLPISVTIDKGNTNGTISYVYDATGVKLEKTASGSDNGNPLNTTTQYAGNYVYENSTLQFFSHPEGYVSVDNGSYSYIYQYKDPLGNGRLGYTENNGTLEIVDEKNYYPFGLLHKGYNGNVSPLGNSVAKKFKYNSIELEEALGMNLYEMELRRYDPAIARWTSIDPVVHFSNSPYNAFDNSPIYWADPSGADATDFVMDIFRRSSNDEKWTNNNDGTFSSDRGQSADCDECSSYYLDLKTGRVDLVAGDKDLTNQGKFWVGGSDATVGEIEDMLSLLGFRYTKDGGLRADTTEAYNAFVQMHNGEVVQLTKSLTIEYGLVYIGNIFFPTGGGGSAGAIGGKGISVLGYASKYGIKSYKELVKLTKGKGLQVHHLIEQRFAGILKVSPGSMKSIALTKFEHQVFTNAWRAQIGYRGSNAAITTANATRAQVEAAAKIVYKDYPTILKALGL